MRQIVGEGRHEPIEFGLGAAPEAAPEMGAQRVGMRLEGGAVGVHERGVAARKISVLRAATGQRADHEFRLQDADVEGRPLAFGQAAALGARRERVQAEQNAEARRACADPVANPVHGGTDTMPRATHQPPRRGWPHSRPTRQT